MNEVYLVMDTHFQNVLTIQSSKEKADAWIKEHKEVYAQELSNDYMDGLEIQAWEVG